MKAKDTLLLNNTVTQNPISARRAWFWHVASHICKYMYMHKSTTEGYNSIGAVSLQYQNNNTNTTNY